MGGWRQTGHDLAIYVGPAPADDDADEDDEPTWGAIALRLTPPLLVLTPLRNRLGLDDGVAGLLAQLGLLLVIGVVWGWIYRAPRRRFGGGDAPANPAGTG